MRFSYISGINIGGLIEKLISAANRGTPCPSCGWPRADGALCCEICGCDLTYKEGGAPNKSRLDDKELARKHEKLQGDLRAYTMVRRICQALMVIFALAFIGSLFAIFLPGPFMTPLFGLLFFSPAAGVASSVFNAFRSRAKVKMNALIGINLTPGIMEGVFGECTFLQNNYINDQIVNYSGLMHGWNDISGSAYVAGKYKGQTVEYSDIMLEHFSEGRDSDGNISTSRSTVFKGQWIVCDLRHKLSDAVFLIEKGERKGLAKKLLGERLNATSDMTTEISAFDERFQIIARDTDTASRVLTAPLLESILRCDDSLNSRTYISFKDEYVQIAFDSGRDTFDISDSFIEKASLSALRERMKSEGKRIADMLCILDAAMQNEYLFS